MDYTPAQLLIGTLQLVLLLGGVIGLIRLFGRRESRAAFFRTEPLPHWPVSGVEVALLLVLAFLTGMTGQGALRSLAGAAIAAHPDKAGLEIAAYGFGFHAGALLGWPLFAVLRRRLHADYGASQLPADPALPRLKPVELLRNAGLTLLLIFPVLIAASLLWQAAGLPGEKQELIPAFASVHSPWVLAAMILVACVLAPINEELIFRGALFRYLRQRFGRGTALLVSGLVFGAIHGNLAGLLPLTLLGIAFALAFERTGDLRVAMLAHALFNLNTIAAILAGLNPS